MWWREFYPKSRPRAVKGGIKAQSKRGGFGQSWWAKRWIQVLESFNIGARLGRGRTYARNGQVVSIDIGEGTVKAKVQGSRPKPYDVSIALDTLSAKEWKKLIERLAEQARFVAKLLTGEMPQDIETVFTDVGLALFPAKHDDLKTDCSCPDWSNPCKHIAAVYYLIGEEFDRDPFLLFKLRGLSRDKLLAKLPSAAPPAETEVAQVESEPVSEPLPTDAQAFWSTGSVPEDLFQDVQETKAAGAVVKRLGGFPFWRGEQPLQEALQTLYPQAAARGLRAFRGEVK